MSELRAPDPTLDALDHGGFVFVEELTDQRIAHLMEEDDPCPPRPMSGMALRVSDARWFAVPCRECFPDAPPRRGDRRLSDGMPVADPHLAWQVTS